MRIPLLIGALSLIVATAGAQSDTAGLRPRWASGLSLGLPAADGETEPSLFTIGGNLTRLAHPIGFDFSLFTLPRVFEAGLVPVVTRIGIAAPLPLTPDQNSFFVPSGGLLGVAAVGSGGAAATGGVYFGLAFLAFGQAGGGVRLAYTANGPFDLDGIVSHFEVGLVVRGRR